MCIVKKNGKNSEGAVRFVFSFTISEFYGTIQGDT
jgi:hypothetical protein